MILYCLGAGGRHSLLSWLDSISFSAKNLHGKSWKCLTHWKQRKKNPYCLTIRRERNHFTINKLCIKPHFLQNCRNGINLCFPPLQAGSPEYNSSPSSLQREDTISCLPLQDTLNLLPYSVCSAPACASTDNLHTHVGSGGMPAPILLSSLQHHHQCLQSCVWKEVERAEEEGRK